jgi:hypothetical protein
MAGSYRARFNREPVQERRRQARAEDGETEAMIRKYMRLADAAMEPRGKDDDAVPGNRLRRYFDLANICLRGK